MLCYPSGPVREGEPPGLPRVAARCRARSGRGRRGRRECPSVTGKFQIRIRAGSSACVLKLGHWRVLRCGFASVASTVTVGTKWARRAARRPPAPLRTLLLMFDDSATPRASGRRGSNSPPHSLGFTPRIDTPRSIVAHRTRDEPDGCRGLIGRQSSVGHGPASEEKRGPGKPSAESITYAAAMRGDRDAERGRTPRRDPNAGVRESGLW